MQACGLDVQWDIECLPIVMPKLRWLAMLRDRFPPQLNLVSDFEVSEMTRMCALIYDLDIYWGSIRNRLVSALDSSFPTSNYADSGGN